eukprot:TRINITY_DN2691_c0_g1_i2.p1 TRINITY_DN2691_c0_g1~~TRINITY_DN2691_c0_g1_i2.p1  ORF type:complete len:290 (-),score=50.73 TRINITY_DN2691_c0_g1_i2:1565-2434(-)
MEKDGGLVEGLMAAAQGTQARPLHRTSARPVARQPLDTRVKDVLGACVRLACGWPSSTAVGKGTSAVSALLLGDPQSRFRAILLKVVTGKYDAAILWASHRGGLLCSCFAGTHNALFLSPSSRSTARKHTSALRLCLSDAKISFCKFWAPMHLRSDAADFVIKKQVGSLLWVVFYRSVFPLATFTAGNVAACIAPSCRRFCARCGHINLARPFNNAHRANANMDEQTSKSTIFSTPKVAKSSDQKPIDGIPDEDADFDKEPADTSRGTTDASESVVAARVRCNLLPCKG